MFYLIKIIEKKYATAEPYSPDFYFNDMTDTSLSHEQLEKRFLDAEWLTNELMDEIIDHMPTKQDMEPDNIQYSATKSKETFERYCKRLFPVGRKFVNYKQLEQYLDLFLKQWSIRKHRDGYTYKCFYSQGKKKKKHDDLFQNDNPTERTIKDQIQCPFVIRFSMPGIKKKLRDRCWCFVWIA